MVSFAFVAIQKLPQVTLQGNETLILAFGEAHWCEFFNFSSIPMTLLLHALMVSEDSFNSINQKKLHIESVFFLFQVCLFSSDYFQQFFGSCISFEKGNQHEFLTKKATKPQVKRTQNPHLEATLHSFVKFSSIFAPTPKRWLPPKTLPIGAISGHLRSVTSRQKATVCHQLSQHC